MWFGAEAKAVRNSWRMINLALILWNLDISNGLTINQVGDLLSCLHSRLCEYHHALPQRGSLTFGLFSSPKGKHHKAQGWPRFLRPTLGRGAGVQSTLKGLCEDATPSGLDLYESTTQGWRHKSPPTLGYEMPHFQGSYKFRKSNLNSPWLQPRTT